LKDIGKKFKRLKDIGKNLKKIEKKNPRILEITSTKDK
jgi:hypothetical protein